MENNLKKTPIYDCHVRHGGKLVPFAGYLMPLQYSKIVDEHQQVRTSCGLFDVSHMARLHVRGKGAADFCRKISVNNTNNLKDGRGQYSVMCLPSGGAVDDFSVFRFDAQHFELIVNASRRQRVWQWLNEQKPSDIDLQDATDTTALIALQGPKATALLVGLVKQPLEQLKLFAFVHAQLFGEEVLVIRSGYTGEDGYEIECSAQVAAKIWQQLLEVGGQELVRPIGLGARDTLRLEMGYMLYGHELDESTSPLEAGLDWVVKLNDAEFNGKQELLRQQREGVSKRLIGIRGGKGVIPRAGYMLERQGKTVGKVVSGSFSPTLNCGIGLAYVDPESAKQSTLNLVVRTQQIAVDVVKPPFITINR